jgi:hypothetical protein
VIEIDTDMAQRIDTAARWLADHLDVAPQPHTKLLRESFGLPFNCAVKAMVAAKRLRIEEMNRG